MSVPDATKTVEIESITVRKWPDAASRDRGDAPHEIIIARGVTVDGVCEADDVTIATTPEEIAALNAEVMAIEERARAQEGDASWG